MIYIEVRFGAINGNALNVDSALSTTSTNPVQNKIITAAINALQNQINNVASQITKEVVEVATYNNLLQIVNPESSKVYIVRATGDIYIWDDRNSEWVLCTNRVVDGNIYTDDIGNLIVMDLESGKSYPVVVTTEDNATSESYTLVVSGNGTRNLISKSGWAEIQNGAWSWHLFSEVGHTHTTADISGLDTLLANFAPLVHDHEMEDISGLVSALAAKQNADGNTALTTTSKSIVPAINELKSEMANIIHAFTIDFQDAREVVQMRNLKGAIKLTKIVADNVATLKLSKNGTQQTLTLNNGTWTGEIAIADNDLLVWQIGRTNAGVIAEINVQYIS